MRLAPILSVLAFLYGATLSPVGSQGTPKDKKDSQSSRYAKWGGKTLDQWIKEIPYSKENTDPSKRENAIRTIQMWPPHDIYDAGGVTVLLKELNKHSFTPIDLSLRVNMTMALGYTLGGVRESASLPKEKEMKQAVALLTTALKDNQAIMRFRAAEALGRLGADARSACTTLAPMVTAGGNSWEIRQAAALALGFVAHDEKLGPPKVVLDALYNAAKDPAARVRFAAVQSFTWLGASPDPGYTKLMLKTLEWVAVKDPEPTVQIWANMAIMSISGEVNVAYLNPIGKMLHNPELAAKIQAAQALGTVGKEAKSQTPALIAGLKDEEPAVVYWCIWALARMEAAAFPAILPLEAVEKNMKLPEAVRKAAGEALKIIKGKTK